MHETPTADNTLGLELTGSHIKGAELTLQQNKPSFIRGFKTPANVKPLYMDGALIVTALNTGDVLVRTLELDLVKEKDIDSVLEFQTEPLLPYPVEQGVIDRIIVAKDAEGSLITVVATTKDHLAHHLEQWHSLDIEAELVTCTPATLAELSKYFCPAEGVHLVAHFGEEVTTLITANNGKLISAQRIAMGTDTLSSAYKGDVPFSELDFATMTLPELAQLRLEVTKVSLALIKNTDVTHLFATGAGALLTNFVETVCQNIKISPIKPVIDPEFNCELEDFHTYAIPIGAALSGLSISEDSINFRQNELAYPHPWKRVQKPLLTYLALSLGLAFAFYAFGNAYIKRQEDNLKFEYVDLLTSMKKPYSTFEEEFDEPALNVLELSQNQLLKRLDFLEKEVNANPDLFPLVPSIPRVSDILAWLNHYTQVNGSEIQLTSFSYKMIKRPELNKKREVYQVKIDIEFTSNSQKNAREFHDYLVAPNDFVDSNAEVKWSSERGKYRLSFFLKDKTYYPPKGGEGV